MKSYTLLTVAITIYTVIIFIVDPTPGVDTGPAVVAAAILIVIQLVLCMMLDFLGNKFLDPAFKRWERRAWERKRAKGALQWLDRDPSELTKQEIVDLAVPMFEQRWMATHRELTGCPGGHLHHGGLFRPNSLLSWKYGIQYCDTCGKMIDGRKPKRVLA